MVRSGSPSTEDPEIAGLLVSFAPPIAETASRVVDAVAFIRPDLVPRARPGWRSVNFRHPKAGFVCAVFPLADHVALVFEHGRELDNTAGLLEGDGKQIRFVRIAPGADVPEEAIGLLLAEAIALRA